MGVVESQVDGRDRADDGRAFVLVLGILLVLVLLFLFILAFFALDGNPRVLKVEADAHPRRLRALRGRGRLVVEGPSVLR